MRTLESQLEIWYARAEHFFFVPDPEGVFFRCAGASLAEREAARLLGRREGVSRSAVLARMCTEPYRERAIGLCDDVLGSRARFDRACGELAEAAVAYGQAVDEAEWDWRPVCLLPAGGLLFLLLIWGPLIPLLLLAAAAGVVTWLHVRGGTVWSNLRQCLRAATAKFRWLAYRFGAGMCAIEWAELLQREGTGPAAVAVIREMLGEDPDSLLVRDGHEDGLRTPRAAHYVVENAALLQLKRKLQQIEGGTIAVCGPRVRGRPPCWKAPCGRRISGSWPRRRPRIPRMTSWCRCRYACAKRMSGTAVSRFPNSHGFRPSSGWAGGCGRLGNVWGGGRCSRCRPRRSWCWVRQHQCVRCTATTCLRGLISSASSLRESAAALSRCGRDIRSPAACWLPWLGCCGGEDGGGPASSVCCSRSRWCSPDCWASCWLRQSPVTWPPTKRSSSSSSRWTSAP